MEEDKKIDVKFKIFYISDYHINKLLHNKNKSVDEGEVQELETLKTEINYKFTLDDLALVPSLKECLKEETMRIEKLIFTSKEVHLPSNEDLKAILDYKKNPEKNMKILDINEMNQYERFAAACILKIEDVAEEIYTFLSQNLNLEIVIFCFLIAFHYDIKNIAMGLYNVLREFVLLWTGIINDYDIIEVKKLLNTLDKYRLEFKENTISLLSFDYTLSFDSLIFKNLMILQMKEKEALMKPLLQYQSYNISRRKETAISEFEEDTYPHYFTMTREHDKKIVALGWQGNSHGNILLFMEGVKKYTIYNYYFTGIIERNYWGTSFEMFDYGLDEKLYPKIPNFFMPKRRSIGQIIYQTNIMGEVPRDFSLNLYDFNEKKNVKIISVKPEYNEKKDCYQLNFYGRAKKASARNFHLISPEDINSILLMQGKVSKNSFNLDYRHPFNIVQAFATSLVSISKKFLVS